MQQLRTQPKPAQLLARTTVERLARYDLGITHFRHPLYSQRVLHLSPAPDAVHSASIPMQEPIVNHFCLRQTICLIL